MDPEDQLEEAEDRIVLLEERLQLLEDENHALRRQLRNASLKLLARGPRVAT
jgi:hypothetical protein